MFFWDSGNSKHWRVIGQVKCIEPAPTGVIKVYHIQAQRGPWIYLSSAIAATSAAIDQTSFTQINCGTCIAPTSMEGIFNANINGGGNMTLHVRNADAVANPGDPKGKSYAPAQPEGVIEFVQTTDSSQAIDYKITGASPNMILKLNAYKMYIRL